MVYKISPYHFSAIKRGIDLTLSLIGLLALWPLYLLISLLLKLINHEPIFFVQARVGKNGKTFSMFKFRTMTVGAHTKQKNFKKQNEADGPVFKIRNDPRFTKFGKVLAHTGFDELPQLINVLKGEMSLVGPRPLPISEAIRVPGKYKARSLIKPGITSTWVIGGSHSMGFKKWMELDLKYIKQASLALDIKVLMSTLGVLVKSILGR